MCNRYTKSACPSSFSPLPLGPSWPFSPQLMITSSVPVAQARNLGITLDLSFSLTVCQASECTWNLTISYHLLLQSGLSLCHFMPGFYWKSLWVASQLQSLSSRYLFWRKLPGQSFKKKRYTTPLLRNLKCLFIPIRVKAKVPQMVVKALHDLAF